MILVLRLLHILTGAFWFGAVVFLARFLMPSLTAAGPAAGVIMAQLDKRGISRTLMAAAVVNVLSGVWLMFIVSGGDFGTWMGTSMGRTLSLGATFAILAVIIGAAVNPPAVRRLGAISAAASKRGGPPTPEEAVEIGQLQGRMRAGSMIVMVLLTLAVAAMAVGRYM